MDNHVVEKEERLARLKANEAALARLEELELCSSAPRIRKGLPSTMSWMAEPRFSKRGCPVASAAERVTAKRRRDKAKKLDL